MTEPAEKVFDLMEESLSGDKLSSPVMHAVRIHRFGGEEVIEYEGFPRPVPGQGQVLDHVRQWGPTVILSDGDVVFQPRKVRRSSLWDAVEGRVLIYIHKELMLDDVERNYPALRYVMVDDMLRILAAMKKIRGGSANDRLPHQGH